MVFLLFIIIVFAIYMSLSIKVVKQSEVMIIERLGKYHHTAMPGTNFVLPFIDNIRATINVEKIQTLEIPPQSIITKDNIIINIGTIIKYQITDPVKAIYEIASLERGIEVMTITILHELVEKMDYDTAVNSKTEIRHKLQNILTEADSQWGTAILELDFSNFAKNI